MGNANKAPESSMVKTLLPQEAPTKKSFGSALTDSSSSVAAFTGPKVARQAKPPFKQFGFRYKRKVKQCPTSMISRVLGKLATTYLAHLKSLIRQITQAVSTPSLAVQVAKELSSDGRLQPLVDLLFINSFPTKECQEEANALLVNICALYASTQEGVHKMMLHGVNQLAVQVLAQVAAVCEEIEQKKKFGLSEANTGVSTVIQDRYSNEAIIVRSEAAFTSETLAKLKSLVVFCAKPSLQYIFLRNLKTVARIRALHEKAEVLKKQEDEILKMDALWKKLTVCFSLLGHFLSKETIFSLRPLMEAFFVLHAPPKKKSNAAAETMAEQLKHINESDTVSVQVSEGASDKNKLPPKETASESFAKAAKDPSNKFVHFIAANRGALNQILRNESKVRWTAAGGPFEVLVDYTQVLDFDVKRDYLHRQLFRFENDEGNGMLVLKVHRESLFEDSFRELERKSASEWKSSLHVVFIGEAGEDAGGLLREWYTSISRAIFNPNYALFTLSGDQTTYMINRSSYCNLNHLNYFKFVGRVIAKAIYDQQHLDSYFTKSFYKHILGKTVTYVDMQAEDKALYNGLMFLLENSVAEMGTDMRFAIEMEEFGVQKMVDLIPNGRNIPVTDANKQQYVKCVCQEKMTNSIRKQLSAFLEGFYSLLPKRLISMFSEHELELLIAGLPNVDIVDLRQNTLYEGYQESSPQIQWFWKALWAFNQTDRAKFLQFVTGTSKTPLGGFTALGEWRFTIRRDDRSPDRLPTAHTCSNHMELPAYESYEKLSEMILKAINEGAEGFGFV